MAGTTPRSYCCQYRESDLDFVLSRLPKNHDPSMVGSDVLIGFAGFLVYI